jgi:putative aldouronate transport system permease protein
MLLMSKSQKVFEVFNVLFMILFGFATFYPFWYVLVASFNIGNDFVKGGVYFWPRAWTVENYSLALTDRRIFAALMVSIGRTGLGVVLSVFLTALVSYAAINERMPGRTFLTFFWYFTTVIGGGMIPYYMLLRDLGLTRSFWLYVIPGLYSFFNFILMRTYFKTIPIELKESAQIDGAGHGRIVFQIYFPLALPIVATLALFVGVGHWNDWFTGAYYQSRTNLYPAATLLQRLLREASPVAMQAGRESAESMAIAQQTYTPMSLQMAFVMILTMPIVLVYPFLQKYYVRGVMIGAIKG